MAVGLVVVGLGNVGSSLLAGIEAARGHLVHPWGTLSDAGGAARTAETGGPEPLRSRVPLAELGDLVLGAFEVRDEDAYHAALRASLLDRSLVDELRPRLRQTRAMAGARHAPTRRHLADALAEDLRGFLEHGGCQRGIVVCTAPGLRELAGQPPFTGATPAPRRGPSAGRQNSGPTTGNRGTGSAAHSATAVTSRGPRSR